MNNKIKFLFQQTASMDYGRMIKRAKEVGRRYHKNSIAVFVDMIVSGVKYQSGYEDYVLFDFINLSAEQRSTYVTRGINNQLVHKYNQDEYHHYLKNKIDFHKTYAAFTCRQWLDVASSTKEEFAAWLGERKDFIIKPSSESCGIGVEKITVANYQNVEEIYDFIISSGSILAEDTVPQNETMASLHPGSINTVRFVSLYDKESDKVSFPFISIRIGNGGVVDNINNGGMSSVVDPNTGIILYPAADKTHKIYERHPITGTTIKGFQIPYWEECRKLVSEAAKIIPEMGYVGWDVAITPNGPLLIEGNSYPGHDIYQMPGMVENKTGLLPVFKEITGMKF